MIKRDYLCVMVVFAVLLVTGCSSKPTVHLYAKYLSDTQVRELRQALTAEALTVEVNDHHVPTDINSNTLLYSLLLQQPETLSKVTAVATAQGFDTPQEQPLTQGNHWYTKNSVGLILFPKDHQGEIFQADIVGSYEVFGCDTSIRLTLDSHGRFMLSGEGADDLDASLREGSWHYRQHPVIELRADLGPSAYSYFELSREQTRDQISALTYTYLVPLQARFLNDGCKLRTALRH